jgi:murein DD-endopeptidase MepM/ murein hydrolase activator NlpD
MKAAVPPTKRYGGRLKWLYALLSCCVLVLNAACASAAAQKNPTAQGVEEKSTITATDECAETQLKQGKCPPDFTVVVQTEEVKLITPPNETSPPIVTPTEITLAAATPTLEVKPCLADLCSYSGLLFLRRPIDPPDNENADATYPFGSTQSGMREPHHGVEFLNRLGTPVLAAGNGTVVVAGTDLNPISPQGVWPILFYGPYSNFYGNLVVIEHSLTPAILSAFPDMVGPIYTLYGHLSEISVQVGQQVQAGEQIGKVGMAGIATGSHLHFEVRIGENSYKSSHNPELWLAPHATKDGQLNGAIAGRFLDTYNNSIEVDSIVLQHFTDGPDGQSDFQKTLRTYEEKGLIGQPPFLDSFGVGDIPAGLYRISFPMGGLRQELVQVYPGQLTVVTFRAK